MRKASAWFSQQDREAITAAIGEAEKTTAGEIVPVIATASGRYDRAEDLVGVIFASVALVLAWWLWPISQADWSGDWNSGPGLVGSLLTVWIGFVLGTVTATKLPALRMPFIGKPEMLDEVERRAMESFHRYRVRATAGGTGILVYVSLYERMVRVVGDDVIAEKLSQSDWDGVRDALIDGLAASRPTDGLVAAIRASGALLEQHFPIQPEDQNELSNELHLID
jgi:putative membrane protein